MEKDSSSKKTEWHKRPENKPKMKEYLKKWREKNKEKIKAQRKKYYVENTEKVKEYNRGWREKHPEKAKEYNEKMKERYKNDPEFKARQREAYKRWQERKRGEKPCVVESKDSNAATVMPQSKPE